MYRFIQKKKIFFFLETQFTMKSAARQWFTIEKYFQDNTLYLIYRSSAARRFGSRASEFHSRTRYVITNVWYTIYIGEDHIISLLINKHDFIIPLDIEGTEENISRFEWNKKKKAPRRFNTSSVFVPRHDRAGKKNSSFSVGVKLHRYVDKFASRVANFPN